MYRITCRMNSANFPTTSFLFCICFIGSACQGQPTANHDTTPGKESDFLQAITGGSLSRNIMVVYQDHNDIYWFGSWEDGLYSYDGHTLIHYTTMDGLPDNRIDEIQEDRKGHIYLTTSKGISMFDGHQFITLPETNGSGKDWKLQRDDMWFKNSSYSGYVYRYDGKHLYKLKIPPTSLGEDWVSRYPHSPSPYAVYTIFHDTKGNIWFGTAALGVCRFDGNSFDWITESDVNELHNGPSNGVRAIVQDENGDFWFNSEYKYHIYGRVA